MDLDTNRSVDDIVRISRDSDAEEVALAAYERLLALLRTLSDDDWSARTECPGWDVAAMVGHLIGAAKAGARVRENLRQQRWGKRHAARWGNTLDAANERQILDHVELSPPERIVALEAVAPLAVAGRMRLPGPLRWVSVPIETGGSTAPGMPRRLALGHLADVIYTRDVWLHTIDIARATGSDHVPDAPVDARIVEDVAAEWAARHEAPVALELTGPAGGRFRQGSGGGALRLDAVGFCRVLSGRAEADDPEIALAADPVGTTRLLDTRVLF